ncbi:MAG: Holliday junction resolvase RuvX [Flavobacteriales bacterium]
MPKILGIDYGMVRTGLAITDELQIIASPLQTVPTKELISTLQKIIDKEKICIVVLGEARKLDGSESAISKEQEKFVTVLQKKFPGIRIERIDEAFTSKLAAQSMIASGMKKSDRQKKGNLDMISAALILRSYLEKNTRNF